MNSKSNTDSNIKKEVSTREKGANKKIHNWSFKPIAQKDQNASLWPFSVIRDAGKASKMECRSLSKLKESFEGTTYNLNDCNRALSRYSAIIRRFKNEYSQYISKITHLLITFDSIYFMVESDGNIRGGNYATLLFPLESAKKLICGFDISHKITESAISSLFSVYKKTKNEEYALQLKSFVDYYIKARKNMIVLDNNKFVSEIFKSSDLNFSSLKYLIFVASPNNAFDYQNYIQQGLASMQLEMSNQVLSDIAKIPSLQEEINQYHIFANSLKSQKVLNSIKKVYFLSNVLSIDKEKVKEIFRISGDTENTQGLLYQAPISEAERAELQKKIQELKKQSGEDVIEEKKNIYLNDFKEIVGLVNNMVGLLNKGLIYYDNANIAEKAIWADNFKLDRIQNGIQQEYDFKRRAEQLKTNEILAFSPFINLGIELSKEKGEILEIENMDRFLAVIPTYFKDERKTEKSLGLGFATSEKAEKSVKDLKKLKKQVLDLFEVFLGVQYGILFVYMKRFEKLGLELAVRLMPSIRNSDRPIVYSKNILDIGERFFYTNLGLSLNKETENYFDSENGKSVRSSFESIGKKSIDLINMGSTKPLTHSEITNLSDQIKEKIQNLFEQYKCVLFMYEQYAVFFRVS